MMENSKKQLIQSFQFKDAQANPDPKRCHWRNDFIKSL